MDTSISSQQALPICRAITSGAETDRVAELGQYMTKPWVADELVAMDFRNLSARDVVVDPTCGIGNFLAAIPDAVEAFGVEIDPVMAQRARDLTGRKVITSDFLTAQFEERPTAVVGSPPFSNDAIEAILNRCYELVEEGTPIGFILPAAFYSLPSRVMRIRERFSFKQSLLPRYIYPRLSMPITWSLFWKDTRRVMIGFALFGQYDAIEGMPPQYRARMQSGEKLPWKAIVEMALDELGGEGTVAEICEVAMPYCPPTNKTPRDTVRRVCGEVADRLSEGRFRKRSALAA
jgi:predicted RNA methylase